MRASLLLSVLRPAGPVAVGISLGFTLSLLSVTWVEEPCGPGPPQPGDSELPPRGNTNAARRPNSVQPGAEREKPGAGAGAVENWEPRVLPYHPAQPGQAAKKAVRTRYISTELGIRQRLLVAVLTSQATLPTLGVAVNRTLGHRLERVVFLTGSRGRRAPPGMAVVTLGEERPIGHLHLALRHLLEQHGDDFDWFFLVPDATYTEACFYNSDYVAARARLAAASEQEEELLESLDVYELFLRFSSLHVLRAVEPALLQRYRAQTCSARLSEDLYHRCRQSALESLGSRTQLAMLLFEQEQGNST